MDVPGSGKQHYNLTLFLGGIIMPRIGKTFTETGWNNHEWTPQDQENNTIGPTLILFLGGIIINGHPGSGKQHYTHTVSGWNNH